MENICIYQFFVVSLQHLLISKPFSYSGQPFQVSSQKFTIFKILTQLSSQPFSVLVSIYPVILNFAFPRSSLGHRSVGSTR